MIDASLLQRAGQFVRLMASEHDGEALGAVRALGRVLTSKGASFNDLAEAVEVGGGCRERIVYRDPAPWNPERPASWGKTSAQQRVTLLDTIRNSNWITDWERDFVSFMWASLLANEHMSPSDEQRKILNKLFVKAFAKGVRP